MWGKYAYCVFEVDIFRVMLWYSSDELFGLFRLLWLVMKSDLMVFCLFLFYILHFIKNCVAFLLEKYQFYYNKNDFIPQSTLT